MRRKLVVLLLFSSIFANAQVWNGYLDFHSQQEIDDFSNFSYSIVTGSVSINDGYDGVYDITNLAGLAGITTVGGNLNIADCNLLTSTAFINITSAGGIRIVGNANLGVITGIPVTSVSGDIIISNNAKLTAITGFSNLTTTGFILSISNHPLLKDISGFSNLQTAGNVELSDNATLADLTGLSNLQWATSVTLRRNPSLTNVDGLGGLDSLSTLFINENAALTNLDGFSNLSTVSILISIADNPMLQDLSGLAGLTGRVSLFVERNSSLQTIHGAEGILYCGLTVTGNKSLKTISGFTNALVASLDIRDNVLLESITGFDNVQRIGTVYMEDNLVLKKLHVFPVATTMSHFYFSGNYIADDISPMTQLDTVWNDFDVRTDTILRNLDFVPNLRFVGGSIRILGMEKLNSINGLSNLDSVGVDLIISLYYCPDIEALSKIEHISGDLELGAGLEIQNLRGLRNLKTVGKQFLIGGMFKVTNLDDLANLQAANDFLLVHRMFELTNINGLRNLRAAQALYVTENFKLSDFCGLYGLFTTNPPTLVNISDNLVNPTPDDIRGGGACAALPVSWENVALRCANNKIFINWSTSNEIDNKHFIVQRSANGSLWTDLGIVIAAGNGGITNYAFADDQPLNNAYYRLAQVDLDGDIHYSKVVKANCMAIAGFRLWPNPASDKVLISIQPGNNSQGFVKVFDSRGALVRQRNLTLLAGQNQVEIDIKGVASGTYFVHVAWNNNTQQRRTVLIKK